jgi:AhpD family alkylhydroperoxidase
MSDDIDCGIQLLSEHWPIERPCMEMPPMPVVAPKPLSSYPWLIRLFFWKQKRTYGRILDPGLLWGRSPRVFAAVALLYGALDRRSSPLAPSLRSLVTVRVSQINHCAFCVDINSATLAKRGVAMDKIEALGAWRDSSLFSPEERLALEYAEAMTITGAGVSEDLRRRLKNQWDDDAIVELTGLIGFQNLSSKFNAALDVPSQGFCTLLPNLSRSADPAI